MSMIKEFRDFAIKGNVVDMAVGVIIGTSFGKIVTSLVSDVIMPPIGLLVGGINFTGLGFTLKEAEGKHDAVMLNWGNFAQTVFDFTIIAFSMFMVIRAMNRLKKKEEVAPSAPPKPTGEEVLLKEIRDIIKENSSAMKRAV